MLAAERGKWGEQLVAEYYAAQGYSLLQRNYTCRFGEIDIICTRDNIVVFAEVKTRSGNAIAQAKEWVTPQKQAKIIQTALQYISQNYQQEPYMRFDVVEVYWKNQQAPCIQLFENAFSL